jgi:hypothetical protein
MTRGSSVRAASTYFAMLKNDQSITDLDGCCASALIR